MRWSVAACVPALLVAVPLGCGGGTPSPKNESDESPKAATSSNEESTTSSDAGALAAEPKPPTTAAAIAAPPPPTSPGSTDTTASGDDPWMASHQMPPKDVLQTVRGAQAKIQACHREGMKRDPSASGEVKIRFVVTHEGVVRVWKDQDSTMTDEDTTKCVGEVIKGLRFPKQKSPGDAWGTYKINFSG
ncbi:MAG: AgmX/PglI C-terminal domain-containing protein [Myxococcota bacterium]|nr:AgmX/PglI C-terminal domain-containing protein [Myxococcota bacterium]